MTQKGLKKLRLNNDEGIFCIEGNGPLILSYNLIMFNTLDDIYTPPAEANPEI